MLTATLDDYGLQALRRLFPGDRELLVSAQVTRPEPSWWMSHCATEDDKRERFLEACRHLPRPLIVYTSLHTSERSTNVPTARSWLDGAGLTSVASVTGRRLVRKAPAGRPGPAPGRRQRPRTSTSSSPRRRSGSAWTSRMCGA